MTTIRTGLLGAFVILAVAACSGGGAVASLTPPPGVDATVTAQNNKFIAQAIQLPAGRPTRLFFKNLDGQPHNVAIYADSSAAQSLFVGETITNAAQVYDVPALDPGEYFFRCDVHPDMTGTVKVAG
jgi:plastocyanin